MEKILTEKQKTQVHREQAIKSAIAHITKTDYGSVEGGYYTKLFDHFCSQAIAGLPFRVPYPLPEGWKANKVN